MVRWYTTLVCRKGTLRHLKIMLYSYYYQLKQTISFYAHFFKFFITSPDAKDFQTNHWYYLSRSAYYQNIIFLMAVMCMSRLKILSWCQGRYLASQGWFPVMPNCCPKWQNFQCALTTTIDRGSYKSACAYMWTLPDHPGAPGNEARLLHSHKWDRMWKYTWHWIHFLSQMMNWKYGEKIKGG